MICEVQPRLKDNYVYVLINYLYLFIWGPFIEILTTGGDTPPISPTLQWSDEGIEFGAWMCAKIKHLCSFQYMIKLL